MAAKKHTYTITINQRPAMRDLYEYTYRYIPCSIATASSRAAITIRTNKEKTHDELMQDWDLVTDALRKVHLLHIMRHSQRLNVRTITVSVDGQDKTYTSRSPGFPFLYFMLPPMELDLPESWRGPEFQQNVLGKTKSKTAEDLNFSCLYSFLAGLGKEFEIERFSCYWTAMNAYYHAMTARYNELADARHHGKLGENNDTASISALLRVLGCGDKKTNRATRVTLDPMYRDMTYAFRRIGEDALPLLYRQLSDNRTDRAFIPDVPLGDPKNLADHLRECLPIADMSAYGCLLLDYPYYMRCNYFHGNRATPLFASLRDPEVAAFRVLNLFLERFLKEAIPGMFSPGWITEEMYEAIRSGI